LREVGGTFDFATPTASLDSAQVGATLTAADGLQPNRSYEMVVRAVNSNLATGAQEDQNTVIKSVTTTPAAPAFQGLVGASLPAGVAGLSSVDLAWPAAAGLFNKYRVFKRFPDAGDATAAYDFSLNGGGTDFAHAAADVPGGSTSKRITGLTQDVRVCFAVVAAWVDGTSFLRSAQSPVVERCAKPTLAPPVFDGVATAQKNATAPTSKIDLAWNTAQGVYDTYLVTLGSSASQVLALAADDNATCPAGLTVCRYSVGPADTTFTVPGLPPGTTVYFNVRAAYGSASRDANSVVQSAATDALANVGMVWDVLPYGTPPGSGMSPGPKVRLVNLVSGSTVTGISPVVTLVVAAGNGTLENESASVNATTGIATFSNLKFVDADVNSLQSFSLRATAPGVQASAATSPVQNAVGACMKNDANFVTAFGGCMHVATELVWSKTSVPMFFSSAAKYCSSGDCDVPQGPVGAVGDTTPSAGYCRDLYESGFSDWRLPSRAEIESMSLATDYSQYLRMTGTGTVWTTKADSTGACGWGAGDGQYAWQPGYGLSFFCMHWTWNYQYSAICVRNAQ
jgi:hypothetical protein